VAHVWEEYNAKVDGGMEQAQALDEVGLERYCCRRMFIGHIDLLEDVAGFSAARQR
jgi:DNA-directed RNA polymerase subunit N (RpoN/RPB10)